MRARQLHQLGEPVGGARAIQDLAGHKIWGKVIVRVDS